VFHGVPDAPPLDIRLESDQDTFTVENVSFNESAGPLTLPAGRYRTTLFPAGSDQPVFYLDDAILESGEAFTAAAYGTLAADDAFAFEVRSYPTTGPGDVFNEFNLVEAGFQAIHASPDAPAVDLAVDGVLQDTGLKFNQFTGYLDLPAGQRQVTLLAGDTPVIDASVPLPPEGNISVFAIDEAVNLAPLVLTDDLTPPAAGNAHVRFVHLSPGAPNVDITLPDGTVIFGDVAFGESDADGAFTPLAAGTYDLEVRAAGTDAALLELPGIALSDGEIYTVFARGFPAGTGDQALGATVISHN
jgi:hypothetical protein